MKNILCISDLSCHSKCSLGVNIPIISHYGHNVSVLPTGIFSTHTGIQGYQCCDMSEFLLSAVKHFDSIDISFDYIYSGFCVNVSQLDIIQDLIIKHRGVSIVDPIIGDNGLMYDMHNMTYVHKYRELIKYADIITPNITEAILLCDYQLKQSYGVEDIIVIIKKLKDIGAKTVIIKSVEVKNGTIGVVIGNGDSFEIISTEKIIGDYNGSGDLFASIVVGEIASGVSIIDACKKACNVVKNAIQLTVFNKDYGLQYEKIIGQL